MWCRFLFVRFARVLRAPLGRAEVGDRTKQAVVRAGFLLFAGLLGAECQRSPPEDFPSRPFVPTASTSAAALSQPEAPQDPPPRARANRCVAASPPKPPAGPAPLPASACPPDPERTTVAGPLAGPLAGLVSVAFPDAVPETSVQAELVRSPHDTARGLMYRTNMAEDRGMLFDLRTREDHKFWMHNTCIPLDLVYLDEDGLIVGIVENAPTLNDEPRGVGCPSLYVLEVNAGWTRRHGVKAGQSVSLPVSVQSP
jgi:uncharacterized membrane protein (UPF0127 family)